MSSFDTDRGVIILETAQWAVLQRVEDSNPVVAPNGPSSAIPLRPVLGTEVWAEVSRWLWANPSSTGSSRSTFAPLRPPGGGVTMLGDAGRASPPARPAAHRWTGEHAHIAPMTGSVHPSGHD